MRHFALKVSLMVALVCVAACGDMDEDMSSDMSPEGIISNALSAGPASITDGAAVLDWDMNELRAGTNGWTCLPDRSDTDGNDPWCVNQPWLDFLGAYVNQTMPDYSEIGIAYMLMGDSPVSNSDPYATEPTTPDDWVTDLGSHIMMLIPEQSLLEDISTDHLNGGPWVMWPDTPYRHLMIPIDAR